MSLLALSSAILLAEATPPGCYDVVDEASGMEWRCRRLLPHDMAELKLSPLAATVVPEDPMAPPKPPGDAVQRATFTENLVIASVVAARGTGGTWKPVRLTLDPNEELTVEVALFLGSMPPTSYQAVVDGINGERGALSAKLATFRTG